MCTAALRWWSLSPSASSPPLVRKGRKLVAATWDEALAAVKEKLAGAQVAGLASPRLTNEELAAFKKLLASAKSSEAGLLYGQVPSLGLGGLPANVASLRTWTSRTAWWWWAATPEWIRRCWPNRQARRR